MTFGDTRHPMVNISRQNLCKGTLMERPEVMVQVRYAFVWQRLHSQFYDGTKTLQNDTPLIRKPSLKAQQLRSLHVRIGELHRSCSALLNNRKHWTLRPDDWMSELHIDSFVCWLFVQLTKSGFYNTSLHRLIDLPSSGNRAWLKARTTGSHVTEGVPTQLTSVH